MSFLGHYKQSIKSIRSRYPKLYNLAVVIVCRVYRHFSLKTMVRGKRNIIRAERVLFKNCSIKIEGDCNTVAIGSESFLCNTVIKISGSGHQIAIGEKTKLFDTVLWMEDQTNLIEIGADTSINGAHIAITEPNHRISIGENCLFSSEIDIRNGDSHSIIDIDTNQRINYARDIIIGNHVWLGKHVKLLKARTLKMTALSALDLLLTQGFTGTHWQLGYHQELLGRI